MDLSAIWDGEWGVGSVEGCVYYMGVVIIEGEGAVLELNLGHPIVTNGSLQTYETMFISYSVHHHHRKCRIAQIHELLATVVP